MIGILTYNVPHRKTYDVLCLLKAKGYSEVNVYAAPLHYVKKFKPLLEHRPPVWEGMPNTKEVCKHLGYKYQEGALEELDIKDEILLICGAGILGDTIVQNHIIINAHPGYIPNCRGLDAFKWAIYEEQPIGVTTHILGEFVDAGEIIERNRIPVLQSDTFHSLAYRVYEKEVEMLVGAIEHIEEKHIFIEPDGYVIHKRMPHELEEKLFSKLEERKARGGNIE